MSKEPMDEAAQVGGYVVGFGRVIGKVTSKEQAMHVMRALLFCMETICDTWGVERSVAQGEGKGE